MPLTSAGLKGLEHKFFHKQTALTRFERLKLKAFHPKDGNLIQTKHAEHL